MPWRFCGSSIRLEVGRNDFDGRIVLPQPGSIPPRAASFKETRVSDDAGFCFLRQQPFYLLCFGGFPAI